MEDCPCRWPPAPAAPRSTSSAATSQVAPVSSRRSISRLGSRRVRSMRHESYLAALDRCLDNKKTKRLALTASPLNIWLRGPATEPICDDSEWPEKRRGVGHRAMSAIDLC